MNFMMFFKKLVEDLKKLLHHKKKKQPKISLLIPFQSDSHGREIVFKWLLHYWKHELPEAEIVIGHSHQKPFCKTEALNHAAEKAHGKVLVILDADTFMEGKILEDCADQILDNLDNHLWFVPYRRLWRLTKDATLDILRSDPEDPFRPTDPPASGSTENGFKHKYGHRYGAMVMMFPREALDAIKCFDERFKGWGGEDVALLRTLDTLYGKHKTTDNAIFHLWHPKIGESYKERAWAGQKSRTPNNRLANEYHRATRKPSEMRKIMDKACQVKHNHGLIENFEDIFLENWGP